ncbi:MAG TPA: Rieske 2Fe-2S domain-containing protein [Stellaceae bacterium]|nr:Rieske 2Fe-2S domain-containing protein [Stellaceae bacterium]
MVDVFVCKAGELKDGEVRIVTANDADVGVYRHGGRYLAYRNVCPHQGGPACEGVMLPKVEDVIAPDRTHQGQRFDESEMHIVCPWHGYEYKLETGECATDRRIRLQRIAVIEREGGVFIAL